MYNDFVSSSLTIAFLLSTADLLHLIKAAANLVPVFGICRRLLLDHLQPLALGIAGMMNGGDSMKVTLP